MPNGSYNTFIKVHIGGLDLHLSEDHIMSLQHKRICTDMTSNIVLTVYDDSAYIVESKILNGEREFSYSYGYVGGGQSPEYRALITHVGAEMTAKGMILTVEGAPAGSDATKETKTKSYPGMTIDQIVAKIAAEQGWKIKINVPCKPIYLEGKVAGEKTKTFLQDGLGAEEFIRQKLIPEAVSAEGDMGNYEFNLETTEAGKFVTFMPKGYKSDNISASYTFVVGQDNERIISFNPDYDKLLVAMMGGGGVETEMVDPITNEKITYNMLKKKTSAKEIRVTTRIAGSSYSADEMKIIAINTWKKMANMCYTAVLELVGDTELQPMQYIEVIVLTPSNVLHHTSGIYYINSIEDVIDTGEFKTTLNLTKMNMGSDKDMIVEEARGTNSSKAPVGDTNTATGGSGKTYDKVEAGAKGVPNTSINNILLSYQGIPYVWGGESRSGADCSGFVHMAFSENNWGSRLATLRTNASGQWNIMKNDKENFTRVSKSDLQSGDVIIMKNGKHIGFALGNGKMIHAPKTGDVIKVANIFSFTDAYRYKRFLNGGL